MNGSMLIIMIADDLILMVSENKNHLHIDYDRQTILFHQIPRYN